MFARLRSPSIRASLYALFGTMLLLLAGMLGASMLEASRAKDATEHVVDLARANRDAFTALKSFRTERGAMGYLLTLKDAIDDNQLSYYRAVRAEGDPALAAVIAACTRIACGNGDAIAPLRGASERLPTMRKSVDEALRAPLGARNAAVGKELAEIGGRIVTALQAISSALTAETRTADRFIVEQ